MKIALVWTSVGSKLLKKLVNDWLKMVEGMFAVAIWVCDLQIIYYFLLKMSQIWPLWNLRNIKNAF